MAAAAAEVEPGRQPALAERGAGAEHPAEEGDTHRGDEGRGARAGYLMR